MRSLVVADIHGNLEALQSVIRDAEKKGGFDQIWSLGDIVGYGPDPGACLDLLQYYDTVSVAGNSDLAAVGGIGTENFNEYARAALRITTLSLTFEQYSYLLDLPFKVKLNGSTLVHASPQEPYWRDYLRTPEAAQAHMGHFDTPMCLVGHTHVPFIYCSQHGNIDMKNMATSGSLVLGANRCVINPGAVGQPRDKDPRASYAIYDMGEGQFHHHRVKYDIVTTQAKMKQRDYPEYLIQRLAHGF